MRRTLTCVGTVLLASLLSALAAEPCERICVQGKRGRHALSRYKFVLAGKVVRSHGDSSWTVEPVRVWRGPGDLKQFRVENRQGMCGYSLVEGAYYVFYVDREDEDIGDCLHEPLSLGMPAGLAEVAALDRARRLPALRVPEEALVPPHHLTCSSDSYKIDDKIGDADRIVIGRMAQFRVEHQPSGSRTVLGRLRVTEFLKGSGPRSFDVQIDYPRDYGGALVFEEPEIWFIGPREAYQQRALVTAHVPMHGEASVRGRVQRWQALGATCTPS